LLVTAVASEPLRAAAARPATAAVPVVAPALAPRELAPLSRRFLEMGDDEGTDLVAWIRAQSAVAARGTSAAAAPRAASVASSGRSLADFVEAARSSSPPVAAPAPAAAGGGIAQGGVQGGVLARALALRGARA
jgi:hypothetical protein